MLSEQLNQIRETLAQNGAAMVAVSKQQPVALIQEALSAGICDFGENYVQELLEKQKELPFPDIRWHFIGQLQSNKLKFLQNKVFLIHSVDRIKLVEEMIKLGGTWSFLIQLSVDPSETQKAGATIAEAMSMITRIQDHPLLKLRGFMGIGPAHASEDTLSELYKDFMKSAKQLACHAHVNEPIFSLGMSGDYALALQAGSNLVRLGSILFGSRKNMGQNQLPRLT